MIPIPAGLPCSTVLDGRPTYLIYIDVKALCIRSQPCGMDVLLVMLCIYEKKILSLTWVRIESHVCFFPISSIIYNYIYISSGSGGSYIVTSYF